MAHTPRQIPLAFPVHESLTREDFMPAPCNADALQWIDRYPDWPYPALILYGPKGSGKTHLLSLWAQRNNDGISIDDAQNLFGTAKSEEELFHAFNTARENGEFILMTLDKPVAQQSIILPDLASRLRAAPSIAIETPDDVALQGVLVKLFHDRQMRVEPDVIAYILPRIERSFNGVRALVERLDTQSMAAKRSVTIPLVRDSLSKG